MKKFNHSGLRPEFTYMLIGGLTVMVLFVFGACAGMLGLFWLDYVDEPAKIANLTPEFTTPTIAPLESARPESPLLEATAMPLPQPTTQAPAPQEPTETPPDQAETNAEAPGEPPDLEILSDHTYVDEHGRHHIVGELRNNSDQPMEFVEVIAKYYDGDELKGANLTFTDPDVIAPGQVVPFDMVILRREHWANQHTYELLAKGYPVEELAARQVVVVNQSSRLENGFLYVSGQVQNVGPEWMLAKAVVTLYDGDNQVINSKWDYIEKAMIAPGEMAKFEVKLEHQTNPDNYHYRIQMEEETVSPPVVVDHTPTPVAGDDN